MVKGAESMSDASAMTGAVRPSLAEKVRFLCEPFSYPHAPQVVTATETHMSWVFLAGEFAFKLKKPVCYEYLDFTTLAAREWNCREELRLNQRLAPDVYLDVVPLRCSRDGRLTLAGDEPIIDWLVKMRRLPDANMLDWRIAHGPVSAAEIQALAKWLTDFYVSCPAQAVTAEWVMGRFKDEHERDSRVLLDNRFDLDHESTPKIMAAMAAALYAVRPLIRVRVDQCVYIEGHGDLRPEHVCLEQPPVIIDCLEFNRELRVLDPFDELAFLDLECQRLGAAWIGDAVLLAAKDRLANPAPPALLHFYRAARGLLRARLALAHLLDPDPRTPEKWQPRAREYLALVATDLRHFADLCPGAEFP
jgi:aminoglycoside phosphotransferase family enzyme